ncbi:phosphomannomutase [Nanoarchaeota archaeon]
MSVFKAYDIRGIYGKELTDELIYKIGLAFGEYFNNFETIGILRDIRVHSERIKNILVNSLLHTHNVLDFGIGSTPEAHYIAKVYSIPVLMITASHNPPEYNGIKPIRNNGDDLSSAEIKKIEDITNNIKKPSEIIGKVEEENGIELYKWYMRKKFKDIKGFRIGYDPANSVLSLMKDILQDLGNDVYIINEKLDGNFPSHSPDPSVDENLKQLIDLVKNKKLDIGFGFDGDGDRIGIVDSNGNIIKMDKYIVPFIKENRKFVVEISLPVYIRKYIENNGGKYILSRTGHTFVKENCRKNDSYMGIEYSGHIYFMENDYIDDGLFGGLMLLKQIKKGFDINNIKVPEFNIIRKEVPKNIDLIKKAKEYGEKNNYELNDLNGNLDGIELLKDNIRILVRESQTEPIYRVIIESYDKNIDINKIFNDLTS